MKILMIIDRYAPIWGGAENQLKQLIPHFKTHDIECIVVTRRWHHYFKKYEILEGTPVFRVGLPGTNLFSTLSYIFGLFLFALRNKARFEIIHSHGAVALGALGKTFAWMTSRPNLAKVATAGKIPVLKQKFFGEILLYLFKKSNAIICLSEEIETELFNIGIPSNKIVKIKNGVDTNRFHPLTKEQRHTFRKKHGWDENDPIILFSGRLVPLKGPEILLDAWETIVKSFPNARLILLGDGKNQIDSVEETLKTQVKTKQLPNVYFEGSVNNPEHYLGIADIFVLPSRAEGLPNTLLEAMSSGLAVVASNIGGVTDLVTDGKNGILFPTEDYVGLSQAIIDLLNNPAKSKEISLNARINAESNLSFQQIAVQYFELYKKLA